MKLKGKFGQWIDSYGWFGLSNQLWLGAGLVVGIIILATIHSYLRRPV